MLGSDQRMEELAIATRIALGIPDDERPDPLDVLRRAKFAKIIDGWRFVDDDDLPRAEALWDDASREILIREGLKVAIQAGDADVAFTVFHELAHVALGHRQRNRAPAGNRVQHGRFVEGDEADADWLAGTLMAPAHLAEVEEATDLQTFAGRFRMPLDKALVRLEELKRRRRKELGLVRSVPKAVAKTIDTGDFDEAMPEMMRNSMNWNNKEDENGNQSTER